MAAFRYRYYNRRPDGAELEDCVCRAISAATGLKYEAVDNLLALTAQECGCDKLNIHCYHNLIDGTLCYKRYNAYGATVGELSDRYRDKRLIIRISGHLTCSLYGTVVDTWDCTGKRADVYWIIE